jgi:hypothetical protein
MNEEYRKQRMCLNKVGHDTRPVAKVALDIARRQFPGTTMDIYKCPYCHLYHIGRDGKK